MKILVLGGTHFFGTHLVQSLIEEGHEVTVATRGNQKFPFKGTVNFVVADRNKLEDLQTISQLGPFDIIYDQLCMSAKNAHEACTAFRGQCKRYVFTSTGSVYDAENEVELIEEAFDHERYLINLEDTTPYNYQEAKRQAEAVFSKMAPFPVVMIRFPIVLGKDDFTKRLFFHIDAIKNGKEIYFPNLMAQLGFIRSDEAGRFLSFIGKEKITGAVNAVSSGYVSLFDLVAMIESLTRKRAIFADVANKVNHSPFGFETDFMMSNKKAESLGFKFEKLSEYLPELIKFYLLN